MNWIFGIFLITVFICPYEVSAGAPAWAKKNTQKLVGSTLKVACSGTGPSIDTARQDALNSCRTSARQQLITNIKVKTLVIQTEKSSGIHEEITEDTRLSGLKCIPEKDEVEEQDGSVMIWMLCRFDLKAIVIEPLKPGDESETQLVPAMNGAVTNKAQLSEVRATYDQDKVGTIVFGKRTSISIASIPSCESMMIRGQKPRVVSCKENPMSIVLDEGDQEIIVRVSGYEPKTIKLGQERSEHENVQVILDPL